MSYGRSRNVAGEASYPQRKRRKATISMIEFLRPEGYWPYPYSVEQGFEVLRAMVASAVDVSHSTRWGPERPIDLMSSMGGGLNRAQLSPITSLEDLRQRFHYTLLSRANPEMRQWREETRFKMDGTVEVAIPHYKPFAGTPYEGLRCEADVKKALDAMFGLPAGTKLVASPNPYHPKAIEVVRVEVVICPKAFYFNLQYGYDGSSWDYTLAKTQDGESFLDTFQRARLHLDLLLKGSDKLAAKLSSMSLRRYSDEASFWIAADRPVQVGLRHDEHADKNLRWTCYYRDPRDGKQYYALALADGTIVTRISGNRHEELDGLYEAASSIGDWDRPTPAMIAAAQKLCKVSIAKTAGNA